MIINPYSISQGELDKKLPKSVLDARDAANKKKKPGEPYDCAPTAGLPFDSKYRILTRVLHELAHSTGYYHDRDFYDTQRFFMKVATEELGWRLDVTCRVCCETSVPCETVCPKCTWTEDPKTCNDTKEQCRPDRDEVNYTKPFFSLRDTGTTTTRVPATTRVPTKVKADVAEAEKQFQIMRSNKCVFGNKRPCTPGVWDTGRKGDRECHWNKVCAVAAIREARALGQVAYDAPVQSTSKGPVPSTPRISRGPTPAPVPVPPPKCSGMERPTATANKPTLPPGHAKTGVPPKTISDIQNWLVTKIKLNPNVYRYTKAQDAFYHYTIPPGKFRKPVTKRDFEMLGYFQYQCRALMCAIRAEMPDSPVAKRLVRNFSRALTGIDATGNQGVMRTGAPGSSASYAMAVNIDKSVAKIHGIIAHEMAHCALHPPEDFGLKGFHQDTHSNLWKRFIRIGIDRLEWKFVEFAYPNVCLGYNICDLRDMDQTKVYNESGKKVYGTRFLGNWAK
jgi:hypothetical protein